MKISDNVSILILFTIFSMIFIQVLGFITAGTLNPADTNGWLNTGPEKMLGIPVNIHHDLVGILFILTGVLLYTKVKDKRYLSAMIGFGLGLLIQHLFTEGFILISAI